MLCPLSKTLCSSLTLPADNPNGFKFIFHETFYTFPLSKILSLRLNVFSVIDVQFFIFILLTRVGYYAGSV